MSISKNKERIEKLDYLIRHQQTGNPEACAQKLGISKRQLYNIVNELVSVGVPVEYNRETKRFIYSPEGKLNIFQFEKNLLAEKETAQIKGGNRSLFKIVRFVKSHFTPSVIHLPC